MRGELVNREFVKGLVHWERTFCKVTRITRDPTFILRSTRLGLNVFCPQKY